MSVHPTQPGIPSAPAEASPARKSRPFWSRFWTKVSSSRWLLAGTILVGLAVLFVLFLGGIAVFDWSESTPFCSSCHMMNPEVTAFKSSPHARTDCGTCHVGPGPMAAVQAKLANVKYLWLAPTGAFAKPIASPIKGMRPVEVVCEQCHWPEKFYEDRMLTLSNYAQDQTNTLTRVKLLLKTGGGTQAAGLGRGIHWHIENPVYYIATDEKRQDIPWVQATFNGKTTEYLSTESKLTPEQIASSPKRKVDCIDCHNRATHIFQRPSDALDASMASGVIPGDLPFIKREGVKVLEKTYATAQEGAKAIAGVEDFYKTQYPDVYAKRKADVQKAIAGLQNIFNNTQFPDMKVTWETHPNNIGHLETPGCFRCHDGKHVSKDNQAIRLECNICHSVPQVITTGQPAPALPLAKGVEPDSHKSTTWLAEHRTQFDATCAACHTVGNPGGTDNSSFCSNSACHGTDWKYAALNAPQMRQTGQPPSAQPTAGSQPAAGGPPAISHDLAGRDNCTACHDPAGNVKPAPKDHAGRTVDTCQACHKPAGAAGATAPAATPTSAPTVSSPSAPAAGGPPAISHDLAGRDNCTTCHDPAGNVKPAPKDHAGRTVDTCQSCHKPAAATSATTPAAPTAKAGDENEGPTAVPHDVAGRENCLTCHNPTGGVKPAPKDHAGRTADTCQACHKPKS